MRPIFIFIALIVALILLIFCVRHDGPSIQAACIGEAENSLSDAGMDWAKVVGNGRRITVTGDAPSDEAQTAAIAAVRDNAECVDTNHLTDNTGVVMQRTGPYITRLVKGDDDRITLSGNVPSENQEIWLVSEANSLVGETNVTETLEIAPGQSEDWRKALVAVTGQANGFEEMTATLTDDDLKIEGRVDSVETRDSIESALRASLPSGITAVINIDAPAPVVAAPAVIDNYETIYDYDGSRVALDGYAPDGDSKTWLVGEANDHVGETNVSDGLEVADGAPEGWRNAMESVTSHVRQYKSARASLRGQSLSLEGDAPNSAVRDLTQSTIVGRLPTGFEANFSVSTPDAAASSVQLSQEDVSCQVELNQILSGEVVLFDFDSFEVKPEAQDLVTRVSSVLGSCPEAAVDIVGRTDPRGSEEYNLKLSQERAQAVANALAAAGLDSTRMKPVGYGETVPLSEDDAGMAQARRVEFVVTRR